MTNAPIRTKRTTPAVRALMKIMDTMPAKHPHLVWLRRKGKQMVLELHVYDKGTRSLLLQESTPRPDLIGRGELAVPLFGDESPSDIDMMILAWTDKSANKWFENRERPDWAALTQAINDRRAQAADQAAGRVRIALPGKDF